MPSEVGRALEMQSCPIGITQLSMKTRPDPARLDRLWRRYWDIANGRSPGLRLPILRHLALTNDPVAMLQLADELAPHGRPSQPFTAAGLMHRAYRRGSSIAAQNLAADAFNRSDLKLIVIGCAAPRAPEMPMPRGSS